MHVLTAPLLANTSEDKCEKGNVVLFGLGFFPPLSLVMFSSDLQSW